VQERWSAVIEAIYAAAPPSAVTRSAAN
jgi:hypothetical protein